MTSHNPNTLVNICTIINNVQCRVSKINTRLNNVRNKPLFDIQTDDGTTISDLLPISRGDLVKFITDGGVTIQGQAGSALIDVNPNNLFTGVGTPVGGQFDPPSDPSRLAFYVDTALNELYFWNPTLNAWILVNDGAMGATGATGATGLTGNKGITGQVGPIGNTGAVSLNDLSNVCIEGATGGDILLFGATCWGNTALCINILCDALTSDENLGLGTGALTSLTSGDRNTAVGFNALNAITTSNDCTAVGHNTLTANTATQVTGVGSGALASNTTGSRNTAVGYNALNANTSAIDCTAVGREALAVSTGIQLTAVGSNALAANTTGLRNTAVGHRALDVITTGDDCTAVGNNALGANTASEITAVGASALLENTTGLRNTACGAFALRVNTTAADNTAIGHDTLILNTTGLRNTAVGADTGTAVSTGFDNTFIGALAGLSITTGSSNTCLGVGSDITTATAINCTAIGDGAVCSAASNQIHLGTTILATAVRLGGTQYQSAGAVSTTATGILTTASDERLKSVKGNLTNVLDKVMQLQGVYFKWKNVEEFGDNMNIGLIAQNVEPHFPELVGTSKTPEGIKSLQYNYFTAVLLEAIKEQQVIINKQQVKINKLEQENIEIRRENTELKTIINNINERLEILEQ